MLTKYSALSLFILIFLLNPIMANADTAQDKADLAVSNILFDYSQGDEEFASYRIDEYGYAHVTFATNTPDKLYREILNAMQAHQDIRDVIPDKGGPTCSLW